MVNSPATPLANVSVAMVTSLHFTFALYSLTESDSLLVWHMDA